MDKLVNQESTLCNKTLQRVPFATYFGITSEILASFEAIKALVDDWELKVQDAAQRSTKGEPSPRYQKAMQLLEELRRYL